MELLFVVLGGILIGGLLRYLLPGRRSHGAALLPAMGGITAAVVWAALTWVGWTFDGGWIWVVSLLLAGVASLVVGLVLPNRRRDADDRMLAKLNRA